MSKKQERFVMKKQREKAQPHIYSFSGPSLGASIVLFIPLLALKLLGILDIGWIWVTCPLWIGWVLTFSVWLWLSTVSIVCQTLKPIVSASSISRVEDQAEGSDS